MKQNQVANIKDYGYKDNKIFLKVYSITFKVIVCLTILLLYIPIFIIALQSFNSSLDLTNFGNFTLKWYKQINQNRSLFESIKNTFLVSIIAVAIATVIGTLLAIGIYSVSNKNKKRFIALNNIPILNADIVTGLSLMFIFSMLLPIFPYMFGLVTLVLAHIFFTLPYVILSVLPKLSELDENLMDAALDLGIKPFKAIYKVVIPAIRAAILAGMLLAFTMSIDDFIISFFTTGNGYDNLSIWIYSSIGKKSLTPSVYAFNTLMNIVILIVLLLINFLNRKTKGKKI